MQFRRNGHSDDRRRRVLRDELLTGSGEEHAGEPASPAGKRRALGPADSVQRYSAAALAARQAPITCLIPKRFWTLVVLGLLGAVCIAGIEALYACTYQGYSAERRAVLVALDVTARGSLAAWYASLLLAGSAAAAVMVYSLRRHRLDDYRARYRVWLWASVAFLLASADTITGLHTSLSLLAADLIGDRVPIQAHLWWVGALGAVGTVAGLRLVIEMRACFLAVAAILVAAAGFATAVCLQVGLLTLDGGLLSAMAQSTSLLAANLSLAGAVLCYARHVYRDAQGELPPRRRAVAKGDKSSRPSAAARLKQKQPSRSLRVDAAHAPETAASRSTATAPVQFNPSDAGGEEADQGEQETQHLSRAERRRLRKQMRNKGD